MMTLSQEEKGLPQKISDDIIALILEENLKPGDKLPNETILSQRLDVGRSSLREAMKLLASRNIVTVRQGSGTYIAASPGMVEDPLGFIFIDNKQKLVQDLLEVRFLLEPSIAAMAATRADEKGIKKITALCDEVETLLKNHEDHTQKDIDFHTAIALSSKNVVVPRLIPVINSSIPLFVETTGGILRRETIESHREIADAIACHDPLRAQEPCISILSITANGSAASRRSNELYKKPGHLAPGFFRLNKQAQNTERCKYHHHNEFRSTITPKISNTTPGIKKRTPPSTGFCG